MKITDFPFNPLSTKEEIEKGLAFLSEKEFPRWFSNANYRIVYEGGTHYDVTGAICHASLSNVMKKKKSLAALVTHVVHPSSRELRTPFLDWLLNRSFAAPYVLARNEYGFVLSGDIPGTVFHNIAIISRHMRELPDINFQMFNHLVKEGLSEDFAYVISFNASPTGTTVENSLQGKFLDKGGGHRAWRLFRLPALKNFLDRDFGPALGAVANAPWRTHQGIYGGLNLCSPNARDSFNPPYRKGGYSSFATDLYDDETFRGLLREYRGSGKKEEEGYRPPNPFTRPTPPQYTKQEHDLSYQEVIDVAAPYLRKEGYKV